MAATESLAITEQWIRERLNLEHKCLADVRSLHLPGTYESGKIGRLGISLKNFVRLKTLDLSHNALVSVEGILHLKLLETLNLYYNGIVHLHDVLALRNLQNLKELDLRLNPVVKKDPFYRLHLVHAISKLRKLGTAALSSDDTVTPGCVSDSDSDSISSPTYKIHVQDQKQATKIRKHSNEANKRGRNFISSPDDCAVRDRERKAALMHFSTDSDFKPRPKSPPFEQEMRNNSSDLRLASVNRIVMSKLSFFERNEEAALEPKSEWNRKTVKQGVDSGESDRSPGTRTQGMVGLSGDVPAVTFAAPSLRRHRSAEPWPKTSKKLTRNLTRAESNFTPHPSNRSVSLKEAEQRALRVQRYPDRDPNPVLHPPRLRYHSTHDGDPQRGNKPSKGACGKPMELLLSLVDEYWSREKSERNTKRFFNAVRIIRTMEQEVVSTESETTALRKEIQTLTKQLELRERDHRAVAVQLERAQSDLDYLDRELRSVLEENVSLQKQLIRFEQQLLTDKLKEMPDTQQRGG